MPPAGLGMKVLTSSSGPERAVGVRRQSNVSYFGIKTKRYILLFQDLVHASSEAFYA